MFNSKYKDHNEREEHSNLINYFQTNISSKNIDEIKLVKTLENNKNTKYFLNKMLIILALFEDLPPDNFNSIGNEINQISNGKKKIAINILKNVFLT
ncbi:MAG: hypothetical protein ACFFA3_19410 [Promethearchaeota archaeon]